MNLVPGLIVAITRQMAKSVFDAFNKVGHNRERDVRTDGTGPSGQATPRRGFVRLSILHLLWVPTDGAQMSIDRR